MDAAQSSNLAEYIHATIDGYAPLFRAWHDALESQDSARAQQVEERLLSALDDFQFAAEGEYTGQLSAQDAAEIRLFASIDLISLTLELANDSARLKEFNAIAGRAALNQAGIESLAKFAPKLAAHIATIQSPPVKPKDFTPGF